MRNRKHFPVLFILCAVLLLCLTGCGGEKAAAEENRRTLEDTVVSGSAALGITDVEVISIEYAADADGNKSTYYVIQAKSEQFGKLTPEEMVKFFRDLHKDADVSIAHHIGCQADMFGENPFGGLHIRSGDHTYMYRYRNNAWLLYRDGEIVYDSSENKQPSADSDGGAITLDVPCFKCGGDGVTHDNSKQDDNLKCIRCDGKGTLEKTFANTDEYSEYMKNIS